MPSHLKDPLLTPKQVCEALGLGERALAQRRQRNQPPVWIKLDLKKGSQVNHNTYRIMYRLSDIEAYLDQRRVAAANRIMPNTTAPVGSGMEDMPITDQQWELALSVMPKLNRPGARKFIDMLLRASRTGTGIMGVSESHKRCIANESRLRDWNNSGLLFNVMEAMSKDKDFAKTYSFVGRLSIQCSIKTRRYGSNGLEVSSTTLTGATQQKLRTGRVINQRFFNSSRHSFTEDNRTSGSDDSSGRD